MVSKTKFVIENKKIAEIFQSAGLGEVSEISPLGDGEYNAVFSVKSKDADYVIKIAPEKSVPILTHEKSMMESEVFWYKQMSENTKIPVPKIYFADFSKSLIPTNYFIMERVNGEPMNKADFSKEEKAAAEAETAGMAAQLHEIKNDKFGYIQNGLHENWHNAIHSMVSILLTDCSKKGKKSKRGKKLLRLIEKHENVLKKAECSMVNFDIWSPNIICSRENGKIKYSWIDPERSFWGDRIADFVCLEMMTPLEKKERSLKAYNSVSSRPVEIGENEKIRYAVAQGYLGLIMETEKYYRYTWHHFGWWRNVFASASLFKSAFGALKNV